MNLRCPTCCGCGQVQKALPPGLWIVQPSFETCLTCGGSGWVWMPLYSPILQPSPSPFSPPLPIYQPPPNGMTHYVEPSRTVFFSGG